MLNTKALNLRPMLFIGIVLWFSGSNPDRFIHELQFSDVGTPTAKLPIITASNANRLTSIAAIGSERSGNGVEAPIWSPNGLNLATQTLASILVFDVPNFLTPAQTISANEPYSLSFSQDGNLLIYLTPQTPSFSDASLHVFDLVSLRESYSVKDTVSSYQISPNGKLLAIWSDDSITLLDIHTGTQKTTLKGVFDAFSFRSDSTEIATIEPGESGAKNAVWIWDAITGQRLRRLDDWTAAPTNIAFSLAGNLLAVQYQDNGMIMLWDSSTNQQVSTFEALYDDTGLGLDLLFSSDTRFLASVGSGKTYLWQLSSNKRLVDIGNIDPNQFGGVFNKDNSLLIYWDYTPPENQTRLWSIPGGQTVITLPDARDPQFSPDGTMLATWGDAVQIWAVQ